MRVNEIGSLLSAARKGLFPAIISVGEGPSFLKNKFVHAPLVKVALWREYSPEMRNLMEADLIRNKYDYTVPPLPRKIRLYILAMVNVPFYRYGEIGNVLYTVGKNILDGIILFTMFSMAEKELKVAAVLGVTVKYAYPGISLISSNFISGFIDRLESLKETKDQILKLIWAHIGIGIGQALGGVFLLLCFPPVFHFFFNSFKMQSYLLVVLYFFHHVCDGSAQIVEGRTWFKIIEIKIRNCDFFDISKNFWVIYILSMNFQLVLGQLFLWGSLGITAAYSMRLAALPITLMVYLGLCCVVISKFILPIAYKLKLCF